MLARVRPRCRGQLGSRGERAATYGKPQEQAGFQHVTSDGADGSANHPYLVKIPSAGVYLKTFSKKARVRSGPPGVSSQAVMATFNRTVNLKVH